MTKRVVIYTRTAVATGQNVKGRQAEQCRAYAAERGWDVTEVFTDDGVSGSSPNRPRLVLQQRLVISGPACVMRLAGAGLAVASPV